MEMSKFLPPPPEKSLEGGSLNIVDLDAGAYMSGGCPCKR